MLYLSYFGKNKILVIIIKFSIAGVCCVILAFLPKSYNVAIISFYLIGKCFSEAAFATIWLVTAELYPTNLRSQAVGICSTVSRIFGLVAPFVAQLAIYWNPLPMLTLGVPSIFSAFMVYSLPETKNIELPNLMMDANKLETLKTQSISRAVLGKEKQSSQVQELASI